MKILVTGSAGFIGGYVVENLLTKGHTVIGIDNYSKYGKIKKAYDKHPKYHFTKGDVKNTKLLISLLKDCDYIIALAAMVGGIQYFHAYAYDLLAENERIIASTFDAAIHAHTKGKLKKIVVISSSMVFEESRKFPSSEKDVYHIPPPKSTYGFQKLACEYFAKGAWEQYRLPYTIVRPFNCVGIGEIHPPSREKIQKNRVAFSTSHVIPDLIEKVLKGQKPLKILGDGKQIRHFTYGGDIGEGIALATFSKHATNEDFNLSTSESTKIIDVARLIWEKINTTPFVYTTEKPFAYDVQKRVPNVRKAKKLLGFEAKTSLSQMVDEVIPWVREQLKLGNI